VDILDKATWLLIGVEHGYVSKPYCETHDEGYLTTEERKEFDEMGDPCVVVCRLYVTADDIPEDKEGVLDGTRA
jgi:hypothetical protein